MSVFNKRFSCQVNAILTNCYVTPSYGNNLNHTKIPWCEVRNILWDTGATNTIISPNVVKALGLQSYEKCQMEGVGGIVDTMIYEVNIFKSNGIAFRNNQVLCGDITDYDVVIGMDIIGKGDFAITNENEETWFSFRYPSLRHLEFEE